MIDRQYHKDTGLVKGIIQEKHTRPFSINRFKHVFYTIPPEVFILKSEMSISLSGLPPVQETNDEEIFRKCELARQKSGFNAFEGNTVAIISDITPSGEGTMNISTNVSLDKIHTFLVSIRKLEKDAERASRLRQELNELITAGYPLLVYVLFWPDVSAEDKMNDPNAEVTCRSTYGCHLKVPSDSYEKCQSLTYLAAAHPFKENKSTVAQMRFNGSK